MKLKKKVKKLKKKVKDLEYIVIQMTKKEASEKFTKVVNEIQEKEEWEQSRKMNLYTAPWE